jgi:hypothetical protein
MEKEFRRLSMLSILASIIELQRGMKIRLCIVAIGVLCFATGLSAATLTVRDETGLVEQLEIQSGNSVALASSSNGNLTLTLDGYHVTISANATGGGGTDTGGGGTDTGGGGTDTGGGGTDTGGGGTEYGGGGPDTGGGTNTTGYCAGNDDDLADCRVDGLFDPWMASTGEVPIWIRDKKTEVFAFTLPARAEWESVHYGYLQLTSPEAKRDPVTQDIFHMWWSETPNGSPLGGSKCEIWASQARENVFWTQDPDPAYRSSACYLGAEARVLYLNFETRCLPARYKGTCDSDNLRKSSAVYQFDAARIIKGY